MQPVPRIFVSATSRDLRTARGLVAEGLRRMECLPIVQDDFPPDYKSVRDMLRTKIQTCNAVVHLAGFYYGAEPQPVLPGPDRRSFTQMEYEIAMELKLPCYVFLCGKDFPFDKHDPEPEEKRALQLAHRDRLLKRDELFYEFATPEELANRTRELQLSVEGLRGELAKERFRRRVTLAACVALFLAGGGYFYTRIQKSDAVIAETTVQLQKQGDLIAQLLAEQQRLRDATEGSTEEIVKRAQVNVARANNQSVEDVRRGVDEAIAEAQASLAAAGEDTTRKRDALRALADALTVAGRTNEAIDALQQMVALIDREKSPALWIEMVGRLENERWLRDLMNPESVRNFREALEWAKARPELGSSHPATLGLMSSAAKVIIVMSSTDEGLKLFRDVLAARDRDKGADHPDTLEAKMWLARYLNYAAYKKNSEAPDAGQVEEAERLFQSVIDSKAKALGAEHPDTIACRFIRAVAISKNKGSSGMVQTYQDLTRAYEKALGPDHPDTVSCRRWLAIAHNHDKNHSLAIEMMRKILAASEASSGPESAEALKDADLLGVFLTYGKDKASLDEAEALFRRVLESRIKNFGAAQPGTLRSFDQLSSFLKNSRGDENESMKVLVRKVEERGKVPGAAGVALAYDLHKVALWYWTSKDDAAAARPFAMRALDILNKMAAEDDSLIPAIEVLLSGVEGDLGNTEQALLHRRRQVQLLEKYHAEKQKRMLIKAWGGLGNELVEHGQKVEGASYLKKSTDLAREAFPADKDLRETSEGKLVRVWVELGKDLVKQGQTVEGKSYLQKAADLARDVLSPNAPGRTAAENALASLKATSEPPSPKPANAAPSLDTYMDFRKDINDRIKAGKLKTTKLELPSENGRVHYIEGSWNGGKMERAFEWNAVDDTNGTFTTYYFNQNGVLMSVFSMREGVDSPVRGVKKARDTFNFFSGKLVGWKRTQDDAEEVREPGSEGYAEKGQEVLDAAKKVTAEIIKAGPG